MNFRKNILIIASIFFLVAMVGIAIYYVSHAPNATVRILNPQKTQLYVIGESGSDKPISVTASILPQFAIKLVNDKFRNMWTAYAAERETLVKGEIFNAKGDTKLNIDTKYNDKAKQLIVTPQTENKLKPGLYRLNVKVKTYTGKYETITQDFTWGVLAINTNKGIYRVGETVELGMAVLDDYGITKCIAKEETIVYGTAKINLTLTSPSGKQQKFSTNDNTITGSKTCADRSFTNIPDFLAKTKAQEYGKYTIYMEAETLMGTRGMDSSFLVSNNIPYDIERVQYPMRIYPRYDYPVKLKVTANEDYKGTVYDIVPSTFEISQISDRGYIKDSKPYKSIEWQVNWTRGQTYTLAYTIHFPRISPEFYLVGPFTIGQFNESREWQIASDSLFSLIQEAHNTATSGTSLAATLSTGATANHLLVLICSRDTNNTINTPAGWTRSWRYTAAAPRISLFYRLATAGYTTGTCSFTTNSGSLAAQILEFSGNSTSGYHDKAATANSSTACNSSPFTATTNNVTPSNPDALLVSGFVSSAGSRTFSGHATIAGAGSTGFTQNYTNGFSDANMSADSAWGEAVNNPAVASNDTDTLSAAGTRCSMGISVFNPSISISQGSYRFFDNANSITPGTALAAVNTIMQLGYPNYPFRIRFLLDIDSPSGTTIGLQSGDFILQYATMSASMATCLDVTQWDPVRTAADGTDIAFYTNPDSGGSGTIISATGSDPSDGGYTTRLQSYYEDNINGPNGPSPGNITNDQLSIGNNQAGLWDLSLVDNTDNTQSRHYCLRIVNGDGSELDAYRNYPQVITVQTDVTIRSGSEIRGSTTIR